MNARKQISQRWLALVLPLCIWAMASFPCSHNQGNLSRPEAKATVEDRSESSSNGTVDESGHENEIPFEVLNKSLISKNSSSGEKPLVPKRRFPGAKSHVSKKQSSDALRGSLNQSSKDTYSSIVDLKKNIQKTSTSLARVFLPRDIDFWCTKSGYKRLEKTQKYPGPNSHLFESPKGLLYVKVPKAASSTMAGVIDRIAYNHGNCDFQDKHVMQGADYYYSNRDRNASFLLGSIRDPGPRAISRIFFQQVSQEFQEPNDENVLKWLNDTERAQGTVSSGKGGFQLQYMSLDNINRWSAFDWNHNTTVKNPEKVEQNVRRVIEQYDFIVVVERIDESLVVLQMLLGIDVGDLLTLDSKVQGSYYYTTTNGCVRLVKSHVSPNVKEYLLSDVWYAQNYGDYLLHAAASASLDRTIEALGRDRVERGLVEYRRLKKMANEKCASKAIYACSADGVEERDKMNCYKGDHGCGYSCINEMLKSPSLVSRNRQPQGENQSSDSGSLILMNQASEAHSSILF